MPRSAPGAIICIAERTQLYPNPGDTTLIEFPARRLRATFASLAAAQPPRSIQIAHLCTAGLSMDARRPERRPALRFYLDATDNTRLPGLPELQAWPALIRPNLEIALQAWETRA